MLQSIRRGATTLAFKIIIGIFIVALVMLFALGDYVTSFTGNGQTANAVAISAPVRDITEGELSNSLYRIGSQLGQLYPDGLDTPEKLRESNLLQVAQRRLVANQIREKEVDRLGLKVSKSRVEDVIRDNEQFFDGDGRFDETRFQFTIQQSGLTTEGYLQTVANQLKSEDLARLVSISADALPTPLVQPIVDHRFTQRKFNAVRVPASEVERVTLDDAALQAYLTENQADFQVAPLRTVSAVIMSIEAVSKPDEVTDEQVAEEFENQRERLFVPEKRTIQQVVFDSEEAANEAAAKLEDVAVTLQEVADLGGGLVELGSVTKDDLEEVLADAAFAIEPLEVTKPVKSEFGWHILTSLNRTEAREPKLEENADRIRTGLAQAAATSIIERLSQDADALVGEGAGLDEVANVVELPVTEFEPFSENSLGVNRRRVANLPRGSAFADEAFKTDVGETSLLGELDNNAGYFLLQVLSASEERDQTFDEAKVRLKSVAEREANLELLKARAEALIADAEGEDKLASIADTLGQDLLETEALNRLTLPRETSAIRFLREVAFELPLGEIEAHAAGTDYVIVVATEEIAVADQAADDGTTSTGPTQVFDSYANGIASDLNAALLKSLEADARIKTNPAAIDRVLETVAGQLARN